MGRQHFSLRHGSLLALLALMMLVAGPTNAEDSVRGDTNAPQSESATQPKEKVEESFNAKEHMDWGTYYDPKNIFCGKYDCYKILGFDYEVYGREKPSTKTITKRYRALSREWHPDKSKHRDAKDRFVKISRAYEVLTDREQRQEYDMMRYNQEAYFQKYGASVLWAYAPQSDALIVVIFLFVLANWFSWAAQKQRWQQVANRLTQATVEEWTPSMGGTPESKVLREEALEILKKQDAEGSKDDTTPASGGKSNGATSNKAKKANKLSGKEKKKQEQDRLRPIVADLVSKMHDFGAGFHQPTWRDLLVVRMAHWPFIIATGVWWQSKFYVRRLQGVELSDEEREILTERAVGHVSWELASDEDRASMVKRELWIMDNLVEWKEEQEIKSLSRSDQKMYAKMKKKSMSFNKED